MTLIGATRASRPERKRAKTVSSATVSAQRGRRTVVGQLITRIRSRFDYHLNIIFNHRHPSPALNKVIAFLSPLILLLTPNDKWTLAAHVPYWMRALNAPPLQPLPKPQRIFTICAYRGQFTMDFAIAVLLAWRGHHITMGYLPKLQSPIKHPLDDDPSAKPYLHDVLYRVEKLSGGRIKCIDLSDEALDEVPLDEHFIKARVKSDLVMYFRRETLDMASPEVRQAHERYAAQAIKAQKLAWNYLTRNRDHYDLFVLANGTTFESAQFCHVAKLLGMPINTHERFAFYKVRTVNHGDDFRNFSDPETAWRFRERLGYTEPGFFKYATDRAFRLLEERRTASPATWSWTLQNSPNQDNNAALTAAGIAPDTDFALVCTNVPFDAGYDGLLGLFPSMRDWLVDTVRHLLEETSIHVVVRAHPAEVALGGGREQIEQILAEFVGHERLTLIAHDRKVNTYGLMEFCKFGVVFSSTTGLEMAMMGKAVVVGAKLYYGGKGFTTDSKNRAQYDGALSRLSEATERPNLTEAQKHDARLFHFILHFVTQWPYPYDKPSDLPPQPINRLLHSPDMRRYLPFLDALTTTEMEWQERIDDYLNATGDNHVAQLLRDHDDR